MEIGNYLLNNPVEYHLLFAVASIAVGAVVIKLYTLAAKAGEAMLDKYRRNAAAAPLGRPAFETR